MPPKVSFTGFPYDRDVMKAYAKECGFGYSQNVPNDLDYLVKGAHPTKWKLDEAVRKNISVIDLEEFETKAGVKFAPPPEEKRSPLPGQHTMAVVGHPGICTKAHLFRAAEKAGFFVYGYGSNIVKNLTILVVGDIENSVAEAKARANGTRIMSPKEFLDSLGESALHSPKKIGVDYKRICFTGFASTKEAVLTQRAKKAGYIVTKSVSRSLGLLVTGPTPGPKKLQKAKEYNLKVLSEPFFLSLLENRISPKDVIIE